MQNALSSNLMEKIAKVMKLASKDITEILAAYEYNDELTHQENMDQLVNKLQNSVFQKNILHNFREYLKNSFNIPIQINFKPLRFEQLVTIVDDWLLHDGEKSSSLVQRGITAINFRNELFKRVCFEERQTIDEFFKINSKKKGMTQIKGFDLYQLLCLILSDYYLYQRHEDRENFFDQENSFNIFIKVVEQYEKDDVRLNFLHKNGVTEIDKQYIQRFQFEKFLEFWQNTNNELTLRDTKRQNLQSIETQTHSILTHSIAVQTSRSRISTLKGIINNALHDLNLLFQRQCNGKILKQIDRIYDFLKVQKIKLMESDDSGTATDQQSYRRVQQKTKSKKKYHYEEGKMDLKQHREKSTTKNAEKRNGSTRFNPPITPSPVKRHKHQISSEFVPMPNLYFNQTGPSDFMRSEPMVSKYYQPEDFRNNFKYQKYPVCQPKQLLYLLFLHYSERCQYLNINQLNHFFYELGLINFGQTHIILNLLEHKFISNTGHINFRNFQIIITELMRQDISLTWNIIQEFARAKGLIKRGLLQKKQSPHLLFQMAKNNFEKTLVHEAQNFEGISPRFNIKTRNENRQNPKYFHSKNSISQQQMQIPFQLKRAFQQGALFHPNQMQHQEENKEHTSENENNRQSEKQRKNTPSEVDDGYQVQESFIYQEKKKKDGQNLLFSLSGKIDTKRNRMNMVHGRQKMWTQYYKQSSQDSLL